MVDMPWKQTKIQYDFIDNKCRYDQISIKIFQVKKKNANLKNLPNINESSDFNNFFVLIL